MHQKYINVLEHVPKPETLETCSRAAEGKARVPEDVACPLFPTPIPQAPVCDTTLDQRSCAHEAKARCV